ncbi:hypothetical protein [Kineococcus sp. SYSU DK001]|uniref:hypothetical protein n=1 Tax=Kineococcus sp. SYSU DK001 TaxID=3383122 RepID=UPI003D7D1180
MHQDVSSRSDVDGAPTEMLLQRLAMTEQHLKEVVELLVQTMRRVEALEGRDTQVPGTLNRVAELQQWLNDEQQRLSIQVASLESRVERGDRRPHVSPWTDEAVAAFLEDLRRTHEQVRARMAYASSFEERLRKLEARR